MLEMSMLRLPLELLSIISTYLDHRSYRQLSNTNSVLYHMLTSDLSLRNYLCEFDNILTRDDLWCGVIHLSCHVYLLRNASNMTEYNTVPFFHYHKIRIPLGHDLTRDIFDRVWTKDNQRLIVNKCPIRAQALYRLTDGDLFLWNTNFIWRGTVFPKRVAQVVTCTDDQCAVMYRNLHGSYYIFAPGSGYHGIVNSILRTADIEQIYVTTKGEGNHHSVVTEYILYRDGDLNRIKVGYYDNKINTYIQPVSTCINTGIRKVISHKGNKYWALDKYRCLEYIDNNQMIDRVGGVLDAIEHDSIIYLLKKDGIYTLTPRTGYQGSRCKRTLTLIYRIDESFRNIDVYGIAQKEVIRLKR